MQGSHPQERGLQQPCPSSSFESGTDLRPQTSTPNTTVFWSPWGAARMTSPHSLLMSLVISRPPILSPINKAILCPESSHWATHISGNLLLNFIADKVPFLPKRQEGLPSCQDKVLMGRLHTIELMEVDLPESDEQSMDVDPELGEELME